MDVSSWGRGGERGWDEGETMPPALVIQGGQLGGGQDLRDQLRGTSLGQEVVLQNRDAMASHTACDNVVMSPVVGVILV